jgi:hypothetical protein
MLRLGQLSRLESQSSFMYQISKHLMILTPAYFTIILS